MNKLIVSVFALALASATGAVAAEKSAGDQIEQGVTDVGREVGRAANEGANEIDQAVAPTADFTAAELAAAVPLASVAKPAQQLRDAAVKNTRGEALGEVDSVVLNTDGTPQAVNVEVGGFLGVGERVVPLKATQLVYLEQRDILVTTIGKAEVEALPAVPQ
jgi:hypothetical protein